MLSKSEGIVIHSIKYGESGRIVHVYTEKNGLISLIAQGLGSKSAMKKIHFQSLNVLSISYYYKQKNQIHRLKEVKLLASSANGNNLNKLTILVFISELLHKSIKEEEPNEALYEFLRKWMFDFHNTKSLNVNAHLVFTLNLSKFLGFYPNLKDKSGQYFNLRDGIFEDINKQGISLNKEDSELFYKFIQEEKVTSNSERKKLLTILLEYYKNHIAYFNTMNSKQILEEVYS